MGDGRISITGGEELPECLRDLSGRCPAGGRGNRQGARLPLPAGIEGDGIDPGGYLTSEDHIGIFKIAKSEVGSLSQGAARMLP